MTVTPPEQRDPTETIRPRRPWSLRIIFWVFILWTILGWLRLIRTLTERELIMRFIPPGMYVYLLVAGLIWGIAGLPALWGILRQSDWTPRVIWIGVVIFPAVYWIERLFLWRDPFAQRNWPLMLLLTLFWFGLVAWAMSSHRTRRYFSDKSDQEGLDNGFPGERN